MQDDFRYYDPDGFEAFRTEELRRAGWDAHVSDTRVEPRGLT